jgi:hypothetical protein
MAKQQKPTEQLSGIAGQAMEQARGAADVYFEYLKKAIADTPSGGNEFAEKLKGYAEKNITMTQNYLQQLSQARKFQDVVRIQSDFMQSLMKAAGEQTSSLAEAYTKTAADAISRAPSNSSASPERSGRACVRALFSDRTIQNATGPPPQCITPLFGVTN